MADVTYKSSNRSEQVTAAGSPALLVLPEGETGHRLYYDDNDQGREQLLRMGAIVIAFLHDTGLLSQAAALAVAGEGTQQLRYKGEVITPSSPLWRRLGDLK